MRRHGLDANRAVAGVSEPLSRARDREARTVGSDGGGRRNSGAVAIDHRDRCGAGGAKRLGLAIDDRGTGYEFECAELVERDDLTSGARRLLDPFGR